MDGKFSSGAQRSSQGRLQDLDLSCFANYSIQSVQPRTRCQSGVPPRHSTRWVQANSRQEVSTRCLNPGCDTRGGRGAAPPLQARGLRPRLTAAGPAPPRARTVTPAPPPPRACAPATPAAGTNRRPAPPCPRRLTAPRRAAPRACLRVRRVLRSGTGTGAGAASTRHSTAPATAHTAALEESAPS